ncbi:3-hydroxybutyryl-CoA dehydrogenase [Elusimicrobiota bacterium]
MNIKKVSVIGSGTMGNGIAHQFALSGFDVTLIDIKKELVDKALATIKKNLERQASKNIIKPEEVQVILSRIKLSSDMKDASDSDIIVEAVFENLDVKKEVFKTLDSICKKDAILATNTSSISVTEIASSTNRSENVVGMHFMNPVPMMKLVEIIKGINTADETFKAVNDLCVKLGKTPAKAMDYPGFISNRILMPMINEACYTLMEGVATKEDIDTTMKLGMNHPMGPLTLADFIGLDVCLAIMNVLYEGFSDSKYRPCPLLRKMVEAGRLGRKTKIGFYDYR